MKAIIINPVYLILQIFVISKSVNTAQIPILNNKDKTVVDSDRKEPTVECLSGFMRITIHDVPLNVDNRFFSGMIYPHSLSKNSSCLQEFHNHEGPLRYKLPLRSCNTMPKETDNGDIEFFNIIVLQPHLKLVTDLVRGYHVKCNYHSRNAATKQHKIKSKETEIAEALRSDETEELKNDINDRRQYGRSLGKLLIGSTTIYKPDINNDNDDLDDISMPGCHMKIYKGENIAENVKIGDPLTLVISIDEQKSYGLHVTDCLVRDGIGWSEQKLVNSEGCPLDNEIMGSFNYSDNQMIAKVTFPAHKFPYTASVYYQCNVRLCRLSDAKCKVSPQCNQITRSKRQTDNDDEEGTPATIEVYSGLYVNENAEVSESDSDSVLREKTPDDALCVSQRTFAIAIAIAGLILMLAVVLAVLCIMARRRSKNVSNSGSSIYSGPYTNTAFSHSS